MEEVSLHQALSWEIVLRYIAFFKTRKLYEQEVIIYMCNYISQLEKTRNYRVGRTRNGSDEIIKKNCLCSTMSNGPLKSQQTGPTLNQIQLKNTMPHHFE